MPPKRSTVWEHFHRLDKNITCKICKKNLTFCGNTTNMMQHLKRKHPTTLRVEENIAPVVSVVPEISVPGTSKELQNQTNVNSTSELVSKAKKSRQLKLHPFKNDISQNDKQQLDLCLLELIVTDFQPLSVVENKAFVKFVNKLQPLYELPSRKTLSEKILPGVFENIVLKIKDSLTEVQYVAVTTDMWSSENNKSYLTVTAHYVQHDKLLSTVLDTEELPCSHTAENIAFALSNVFQKWGIEGKVVAIVTDNGANIKAAVNSHLKLYHVPCVAHTLNLCVTDVMKENVDLSTLVIKCKQIVSHFKSSNVAADKLRDMQKQMGLPVLKVLQDVVTRWNSTLHMIERLIEIKIPISAAVSSLPNAPEFLDANEWLIISDCSLLLKPIETMTTEISGEKYPTLSMVIPLIRGLQYEIKSQTPTSQVALDLQFQLLEVISRRLGPWETTKVVAKATFLDPRFQKAAFGTEENANAAQRWVTKELETIAKLKQNKEQNEDVILNQNEPQQETETPKGKLKKLQSRNKLWAFFDEKAKTFKDISNITTDATITVRQYLELPLTDRDECPLSFCASHKNTYPGLYRMQQKYLCIPGTSVPAERVFSKAGHVTKEKRNRLSSTHLNQIIFLNSNINKF